MKKPERMCVGVNIGDYDFDPDKVMDLFKKYKFGNDNGGLFRYLVLRMDQKAPTTEQLYQWAEYLGKNEVYFSIVNNYRRGSKELMQYRTKEEMEKVAELGGDYYLGEEIGEFGGWYSAKAKGYYPRGSTLDPVDGLKDCKDAAETYQRQIMRKANFLKENGGKNIISLQSVGLMSYDLAAGVDDISVETAPRNMERAMSFARGAQRANRKEMLGSWLAHEFYGGYNMFDPLKAKRFKMEYYTTYLAGIDYVCLESGFHVLHSHLSESLPEDHPLTQSYLKETEDFAKFCNSDIRPGKCGPITKIAFVQGNYDGYAFGNNSTLWGQYYDEKWGFSDPEYTYNILDEVYHSVEWNDGRNAGDNDYTGAPGFGMYDIIPATTPLDVLRQYEWVIFCGWNTMTPEIAETYKKYVEEGGNLLITAAHMRDSVDRDKLGNFADYDWESFLGVKLSDDIHRCNDGYKFVKYSTIDGIDYPGTFSLMCDPGWSAGYTNYVKIEPTKATTVCYISDSFGRTNSYTEVGDPSLIPFITENKVGRGNVIFMANSEYPGNPAVFPIYKLMVKQVLSASHKNAEIKVLGSDKLRFAVYENDEIYKLYILNTDYNVKNFVRVIYRGEETEHIIDSLDIKIIEFKK